MELLSFIKSRQTLRDFTDSSVDRETLEKILESARWAPSTCNLQLTEFIVIDDIHHKNSLAKKVSKKMNWAPVIIVVVYDTRFSHHHFASLVSIGMAVENILLSAHALGLGACPMAGFSGDSHLKKVLNIPKYYEPILLIGIGHPKTQEIKDRVKMDFEDMVHWNTYKNKIFLNDSLRLDSWNFFDIMNYRKRLAPVYMYNNRNNLSTFSSKIYKTIYDVFQKNIVMKNSNSSELLDFISFDCTFAHMLPKNYKVTLSDYIPHTLSVAKRSGSYDSLLIQQKGIEVVNNTFDIVTCVHKFEFTPREILENHLLELHRVLKKEGNIFITMTYENRLKRILRFLQRIFYRMQGEYVNSYDNNPFYKIGPIKHRSKRTYMKLLKKAGFSDIQQGQEKEKAYGVLKSYQFIWFTGKKK